MGRSRVVWVLVVLGAVMAAGSSARASCLQVPACECQSVEKPVLPAEILELTIRPNGMVYATCRALELDGAGAGGASGEGLDVTTPDWPMPGETFGGTFAPRLDCHASFEARQSDRVLAVFTPAECRELIDCRSNCGGDEPYLECNERCTALTAAACEVSRGERLLQGQVRALPLGDTIELSGGISVSLDEALHILTDAEECERHYPPWSPPCDDVRESTDDGCSLTATPGEPANRVPVAVVLLSVALGLARRRRNTRVECE